MNPYGYSTSHDTLQLHGSSQFVTVPRGGHPSLPVFRDTQKAHGSGEGWGSLTRTLEWGLSVPGGPRTDTGTREPDSRLQGGCGRCPWQRVTFSESSNPRPTSCSTARSPSRAQQLRPWPCPTERDPQCRHSQGLPSRLGTSTSPSAPWRPACHVPEVPPVQAACVPCCHSTLCPMPSPA